MRMRTRRLPVSFVAWIALIALPASPSAARADDQWIQIGDGVHLPNPIPGRHNESGRLAQVSIAPDGKGNDVVWAGASHGGLWRADGADKITKWVTITDNFPGAHTLGSFAIQKGDSKSIVIGTGAKNWGNGDGIYYTTTGGKSWTPSNLCTSLTSCAPPTSNQRVNRIVADRSDSNGETLLAATSSGVWLSVDFGQTWYSSTLSGEEATDIVQDAKDASRWYAGVANKGVYLSKDYGASWKAPGSGGITGSIDRISLAACKANEHFLYAIVATSSNTLNGVWRSKDRGTSWANIYADDTTIDPGAQANHTCTIACDPTDADHVFFGLVNAMEVTNATKADEAGDKTPKHPIKAIPIDGGHADYNFLLFDADGAHLHIGNDGGYYRYDYRNGCSQKALSDPSVQCVDDSADIGGLDVLELGQAQTEGYSTLQGGLASSWSHPDQFLAGLQDDGVVRGNISKKDVTITFLTGGDGRHVSIMPDDSDILGYNHNGGGYVRALWDVSKSSYEDPVDFELTQEKASPVLIDPLPGVKAPYVFTSDLNVDIGEGKILSGVYFNDAKNPQSSWTHVGPPIPAFGSISHLDVTTNPHLYEIVGTLAGDTRAFAYTGRRSQLPEALSYSDITPPLPEGLAKDPDGRVNADKSIYAPTTIYYTSGMGTPRAAFMSPDGGSHWTDVTGDIGSKSNDAAMIKLVGNPTSYPVTELFLATTNGVFRSEDGGKCWFDYSEGLRKHEQVDDIVINFDNVTATQPTLYVATHGRGFWRRTIQKVANPPSCSGGS